MPPEPLTAGPPLARRTGGRVEAPSFCVVTSETEVQSQDLKGD